MSDSLRFPTWEHLLQLWMGAHFPDGYCVVIHAAANNYKTAAIADHFGQVLDPEQMASIICGEYWIIQYPDASCVALCNSLPEDWAYCTVWTHGEMISENT